MTRSGRWSQQTVFKNCGKDSCQQGCAENPFAKPHGPYVQLGRRNPDESGKHDTVYLGKVPLTEDQLALINKTFLGPTPPTKAEVFLVIDQAISAGDI